jgi:hypothetical protein
VGVGVVIKYKLFIVVWKSAAANIRAGHSHSQS